MYALNSAIRYLVFFSVDGGLFVGGVNVKKEIRIRTIAQYTHVYIRWPPVPKWPVPYRNSTPYTGKRERKVKALYTLSNRYYSAFRISIFWSICFCVRCGLVNLITSWSSFGPHSTSRQNGNMLKLPPNSLLRKIVLTWNRAMLNKYVTDEKSW